MSGFGGMVLISQTASALTVVSGNVSGTWDATGSPYYVTGNINVQGGQTLEIDGSQGPVQVVFNGTHNLVVSGNLYVNGTSSGGVHFMSNQTT